MIMLTMRWKRSYNRIAALLFYPKILILSFICMSYHNTVLMCLLFWFFNFVTRNVTPSPPAPLPYCRQEDYSLIIQTVWGSFVDKINTHCKAVRYMVVSCIVFHTVSDQASSYPHELSYLQQHVTASFPLLLSLFCNSVLHK